MSPRGRRRGHPDAEVRYESGNDRSTDFNVGDEAGSNFKHTSTPLKKVAVRRVRRESTAPNIDSEESADAVKARTRPPKRRKTARGVRRDRGPGARESAGRGSEGSKNYGERQADEKDESESLGEEKNSRGRTQGEGGEETAELPIAELLRKARGNQRGLLTRYEDPVPLPELTTDTIYVQGRNGFSAVKIANLKSGGTEAGERLMKPVHVAANVHNSSRSLMIFCQGLLGGVALSQVVLIHDDADVPSQTKSPDHAHLMSGIFLFLVTMSLLAATDRVDVANLELEDIREFFYRRLTTVVTLPLYATAMCIHLSAANAADGEERASAHRQIHTWKYAACIIAWFCVALGPTDDLTASHLEDMKKYAN